jgi:iron-regulated transporter 1
MNSVFRTIDLLCLLVAPSLAGVIFDFLSYSWAAIFIALWNILSLTIEYYLLFAIYKEFPALSQKKIFTQLDEGEEQGKITQCTIWSLPGKNL